MSALDWSQRDSVVSIDTRSAKPPRRRTGHMNSSGQSIPGIRERHVCGWCELYKTSEWLTLIPHPRYCLVAVTARREARGQGQGVGRDFATRAGWETSGHRPFTWPRVPKVARSFCPSSRRPQTLIPPSDVQPVSLSQYLVVWIIPCT